MWLKQMDILTFISKLIESLAWPVCALIIAILFRNQLSDLLSRIVKGKIPGGEFEFSDSAKNKLQTAETEISPPPIDELDSESSDSENDMDTAYALLETSARAAISDGWRQLYFAAFERIVDYEGSSSDISESSASAFQFDENRPIPAARMTAYLRNHNILQPDMIALFDELRALRNQSIHSKEFDISDLEAKNYLILTELLIGKLQ